MAKPEDDKIEAVAREAVKEEKAKTEVKALKLREKALETANRVKARALKEAKEGPNLVQILGTGVSAAAAGVGGYKTNRYLRKKTVEWEMVVPAGEEGEGERTMTAKLISDVAPPVLGLGLAGLGMAMKNGLVSALLIGTGLGFAGGSITGSIEGDGEAATP